MPGVLLDSHALYWLVSGEEVLTDAALVAVAENQAAGTLYASPITAWELTIASRKPSHRRPPNLGEKPHEWFREAVKAVEAKLVPIRQRIALEAAAVVEATGHKDPSDCYLVATARVRKIPIITRDHLLIGFDRAYVGVIEC